LRRGETRGREVIIMYARIEAYPVMDRVVLSAVILENSESPLGPEYQPVWACRVEVPGPDTADARDQLWTVLQALAEQLEHSLAQQ
jgi:hypothetical protein